MAELTHEQVFTGEINDVFKGIKQYERYPDFMPGVTGISVLPAKEANSACQVRYDLKLIKTFYYTLNMFEEEPNKIWWNMADSNMLKASNGSWDLSDAGGGKTKAIYKLDVKFGGFVPAKVVEKVTAANLPALMEGFQKLINESK